MEQSTDKQVEEKKVEKPEEPKKKYWTCPDCSMEEQHVLEQLQKRAEITDKHALATIMGNIKQESKFYPNICEGGARVPYHHCHSGGYGLIQWTTHRRYHGLGHFSTNYECDPSSLECQTRYMINELEFQKNLHKFKTVGQSISYYMDAAYYWLGWGIEGPRVHYINQYLSKMVFT